MGTDAEALDNIRHLHKSLLTDYCNFENREDVF